MLSHCANSRCAKPFLRLREGRLFQVEAEILRPGESPDSSPLGRRQHRRVERYWLCDECAAEWTLIYDRQQ
jgi:hypothetical protein